MEATSTSTPTRLLSKSRLASKRSWRRQSPRDKVIVSLEKDVDRMLQKELYVDNVLDSIYSGNTAKDTQGCILLGENRKVGMVVNSRIWMHRFMQKFVEARDRGEAVFITIE